MNFKTHIGIYDNFHQAQQVASKLSEADVSLKDIRIVSKRDNTDLYQTYEDYFEGTNIAPSQQIKRESRQVQLVWPIVVGAIVGVTSMGIVAWNNLDVFGTVWQTLLFMLGFGAVVGAVLAVLVSSMEIMTQTHSRRDEMYEKALWSGLTALIVRQPENVDKDAIESCLKASKPIAITTATEDAWLSSDWLNETPKKGPRETEVHNTIADHRYRAYER